MVIIGSTAIKYHFPDFPRKPKDLDVVAEPLERIYLSNPNKLKIERHVNSILSNRYSKSILTHLSKDDIYTLKISHMFWDIKWDKHMFDIVFLSKKGCKADSKLFLELYWHWIKVHGSRKTSDLTKSTDSFFNNALKKYNHDYLHTIINLNPLYKLILEEEGKVTTSQQKWNKLDRETQLELIREECYVMAFERLANRDYRTAYSWQLKQLILHHLPMWQALFAIQNYDDLRKPLINYKEKIENELSRN